MGPFPAQARLFRSLGAGTTAQGDRDALGLTAPQREAIAAEIHAVRMHAHESARVYGQGVIRGLFLLNGGSAIAMMTLVGSLYGRGDQASLKLAGLIVSNMATALALFAMGVGATIVASALGYFNYSLMTGAVMTHWEARNDALAKPTAEIRLKRSWWVQSTMYAAVGTCALSFALFVFGGMRFYHALQLAAHLS